ncbi:MAG: hypothetical protein WC697_00195 [Patescibacteria group bacterium]|jgi:hypothetical protein
MIKKNSKKFKKRYFLLFFIFIILILLAIILLTKNAQAPGFFYNTEPQPETKLSPEPVEGINPQPVKETENSLSQYYTATFSDSFSGQAWLDTTQTNLYFDWTSQNLIFPPVLDTEEVSTGDFLTNFISEKVSSEGNLVLFVGTHRISQKKQLLIWQMTRTNTDRTQTNADMGRWSKFDFSTLGLSDTTSILDLKKITSSSNWLLFSQTDQNLKINILKITGLETNHPQIESIAEKSWPIASFKDIQIECGEKNCLGVVNEPLTVFKIDANGNLTTLKNLTESLNKKNPDQAVIAKGLSAENWLVVWSKKVPRQSALNPSESEFMYQFEVDEIKGETLNNKGHILTAEYPGRPSLVVLKNKNIFLFWGSYFTQAYEIKPSGEISDLSGDFGWRISANKPFHLYQFSHSIYIKNEDRSIVRWGGGSNVKIDPQFWLTFNPDFLKIIPTAQTCTDGTQTNAENVSVSQQCDSGYLIAGVPSAGTKIYQFNDLGFDLSKTCQAVSVKINFSVAEIKAAQINLQGKTDNTKTEYWLSNDGGNNWEKAEIGKPTIFTTVGLPTESASRSEKAGNDLRYKIILTPDSGDSFTTPVLNSINLQYWYK